MMEGKETILFTLKAVGSICLVQFTDSLIVLLSVIPSLAALEVSKGIINLGVTCLIAIYWVVKIISENKKVKQNGKD